MKTSKIESAILECYNKLFAAATPSADFNQLVAAAEINQYGQKQINFLDYQILESQSDKIVEAIIIAYRVPKYLRSRFRTTILLGCSPKYKSREPDLVLDIITVDPEVLRKIFHDI